MERENGMHTTNISMKASFALHKLKYATLRPTPQEKYKADSGFLKSTNIQE